MIPPEAELAAHMEQVLDVYARPYDAAWPVICMDEQPVQRSMRSSMVRLKINLTKRRYACGSK